MQGSARTSRDLRFLGGAALLGLALALLIGAATRLGPLAELERRIDDVAVAHSTHPAAAPHPKVAVVAIDEETARAHPPFSPLDRTMLARLIGILGAAEPRAIGLDVLLLDPTDPAADRRLAAALRESVVPVVVATALRDGRTLELAPPFRSADIEAALANLPVDRADDVLRVYQTGFRDASGTLHSTLAARLAVLGTAREIALSAGTRPIAWYGRPAAAGTGGPAIATFPAHTLLSVPAAANLLRGRIVLIGATFAGSGDFVKTPFARTGTGEAGIPGVVAHAQILAQLVDGRARGAPSSALMWLLIAAALALSAAVAMARPAAAVAVALAVAVPVLWIAAALVARQEAALALPALPPALAFGVGVGAFSAYQARRLDRTQRQALRALARRVPAGVIEQMMASPDLLRIEGDARVVSVLFTDLAGFTRFSGQRTAADVMGFLRAYLEEVSETVLRHGGTIDKFVGDAVMAFWGAPLAAPDHARRAVACARELDARCRRRGAEHGLVTRIGVHSGEAMVGFVGSRERLEYTAIGDTVNTASRVEGANKHLGTTLCVTAETVEAAGAAPAALGLRPLAHVRLTGRDAPTMLFTTLPEGWDAATRERYECAVAALGRGAVAEARDLLSCLPGDEVVQFQINRCRDAGPAAITLADK